MQLNFRKTATWLPIIIALSIVAGLFLGRIFPSESRGSGSAAEQKLSSILGIIESEYVDDIDLDSLVESRFADLVGALDPHSVYIPAEQLQAVNEELDGSFSGIGVSFTTLTDTIIINEVISGGPAERVGLFPGDRVVTINDSSAIGWPQQKILRTLRGPKGSSVELGIQRASAPGKILPFTLVRDDIPVTSIDAAYLIDPSTAFIRVNKFGRTTFDEFFTNLTLLKTLGAQNIIIDLRGNTGGFLEMANMMANEFLPSGASIVFTHGRAPGLDQNFHANGQGSFQSENVVVLIDENSASASEILAGAIQDNDRGLIVGRRSFGKGLVQRQFDLPDSSAVRLTTARYYTPSGRCIQKPFTRGDAESYEIDLYERANHGETLSADSIHLDKSTTFFTISGREVYGGGGIMPDIFVPLDTLGYSPYYYRVVNAGLLQKFAFNYADAARPNLADVVNTEQLLERLPSDDELIRAFAEYARREGGVAPQWYYINLSRNLIVKQLKALIARDIIGMSGYYEAINKSDPAVRRALEAIHSGEANAPIRPARQ